MAKPKIVIGNPYKRQSTLCVPVRYNFPDGSNFETVYNWNMSKDPDEIERDLARFYVEEWEKRKEKEAGIDFDEKFVKKLKGKKIMQVTPFDDEPLLPDDPPE